VRRLARRAGGLLVALATALVVAAVPAAAQRSVTVQGPTDNPLLDGIPAFGITAVGFAPADFPLRFTLQIGTSPGFATGVVTDTTVVNAATTHVTIAPRHLIPERSSVYWRAVVTTINGLQVNSTVVGPRLTAPWLTLLVPNNPNGSTVTAKRPTFIWTSARIDPSAGRWQYELRILGTKGEAIVVGRLDDTTYVPPRDLEGNTSYRWTLMGWTLAGDTARVQSAASFVVLDSTVPPATILFQNFPNPFPNERVAATCIWFDLRTSAEVELQVMDLRGNHVRSIIPSAQFPASGALAAGRYGRASEGSNSGCDPRLSWDGYADDGHPVPPGVYLIRLRADGVETFRKALFKGR
jgi:hypothetical protein